MRRTANGAVLAAAVALVLTGCGSSGGDSDDDAKKDDGSSAPSEPGGDGSDGSDNSADSGDGSDADADDSGTDGADGADGQTTREVTLEVSGEGEVIGGVVYMLNEMKTEEIKKLPWTKTEKLPLLGAQAKVGRPVTVTPPSIQDASGKFVPAKCVIKVDGKVVADNSKNPEGKSGCQATVK